MARGSETQGGLPRLGVRRALMHLLRKRGRGVLRGQLLQQVCKTVKANTLADLPLCRPLGALPAHGLLAPGAHNREKGLLASALLRLAEGSLGLLGAAKIDSHSAGGTPNRGITRGPGE